MKKKDREKQARRKEKAVESSRKKIRTEIDLPAFNTTPGKSMLLVVLLLLVLVIIQFFPVLTAQGLNIPYGDQDSENARVFNNFLRETFLETGSFPLWNPYLFGGMPMIDSFTFPAYYPPYLAYTLAPRLMTLFHHIALHLLLAGIFTWLLARSLGLSRWSALAAAAAYMLTGYTVSLTFAGHGGKIWTCAYIPLVLYGIDRILKRPSAGSTALAAAAFGLQLLAGHVQIVFYTWLTAALFVLFRLRHGIGSGGAAPSRTAAEPASVVAGPSSASDSAAGSSSAAAGPSSASDSAAGPSSAATTGSSAALAAGTRRPPLKAVVLIGAALLVGLLAASAQYLPAVKYAAWSNRAAPDYEYLSKYSYPPEEILTLAFPKLFGYGDPDFEKTDPEMPDYWGRLPIRGSTEYAGAIVLLLAAAGAILLLRGKDGAVLGSAAAAGGAFFFLLNASGVASFDRAWSSLFSGAITGLAAASLYVAFAPLSRRSGSGSSGAGDADPSEMSDGRGRAGGAGRGDGDERVTGRHWDVQSHFTGGRLAPALDFRFFLLLGSLAAFLAVGRYTPLYRFIAALPGFDKFRAPAQIVILVSFALSMAAGFGLDSVIRSDRGALLRRLRPIFAAGAVIMVIGLVFGMAGGSIAGLFEGKVAGPGGKPLPLGILDIRVGRIAVDVSVFALVWLGGAFLLAGWSKRMFGTALLAAAVVAGLALDLIRVNSRFIHPLAIEKEFTEFDKDPIFKLLASKDGGGRVYNADLGSVSPNEGIYWKIPLTGGYHGAPMGDYWKLMTLDSNNFVYKFLMMTSARYLLLPQPVQSELFREVYKGRTHVYDYLLALPRAYMVFGALTAENHADVPGLLESDRFDPAKNAVVERDIDFETPSPRGFLAAKVEESENERVVVLAEAPEEALLVLTDTFYPGWRAEVDGDEAEILRVNFVQRGVLLEPGDHEIVFTFDPAINRAARLLSLVGLFAFFVLAAAAIISGRKKS